MHAGNLNHAVFFTIYPFLSPLLSKMAINTLNKLCFFLMSTASTVLCWKDSRGELRLDVARLKQHKSIDYYILYYEGVHWNWSEKSLAATNTTSSRTLPPCG